MEIWATIEGYSNYEVSNLGRVRSFRLMKKLRKGTIKELILKQNMIKGYYHVILYGNGTRKQYRVSRLVAQAFIPNPDNKPEVNHKTGIKTDNRASELEWSSSSENSQHAYDIGLRVAPEYKGLYDKKVVSIKDTSIIEHDSHRKCCDYIKMPRGSLGRLVDSGRSYNGYLFYSV